MPFSNLKAFWFERAIERVKSLKFILDLQTLESECRERGGERGKEGEGGERGGVAAFDDYKLSLKKSRLLTSTHFLS